MYEQLERLNTEATARAKRERRRANEIKTRTIQRMQLQMTAPLDIGLEQQDATLGIDQDEMFDLGQAENNMHKHRSTTFAMDDDGDAILDSSDEDGEGEQADENEDDEPLDSEDEREKKVAGLEAELDGLYDAYQGRLRERDAKYKVKEARRKNAEREEEWDGIKEDGSDPDASDEEDGGWDKIQQAKLDDGGNSSGDSSDESEEETEPTGKSRKRGRSDHEPLPSKELKRQRLISKLEAPKAKPASGAASRLWFSQDVFAGAGLDVMEEISDSDENEEFDDYSEDEESSENAEDEACSFVYHFTNI